MIRFDGANVTFLLALIQNISLTAIKNDTSLFIKLLYKKVIQRSPGNGMAIARTKCESR